MGRKKITKKEPSAGEFRCLQCGKLLAKGDKKQAALEIKCVRCGTLNSVFRGVVDQVIITDAEGVILYANSLVESVTGYTLSEVLGNKPSLWGGQMSGKFYKEMWQKIKIKRKPVLVKVTNKKKDGTLYDAMLRISPVFDAGNKIAMFVGIETVIN